MFRTPLEVRHVVGDDWELTAPLVFEGKYEWFVMRAGFLTDFASIPRPLRWLFDSAGFNAEAGVLHDAAWRESKRREGPRVDAWDADGLFRRALRLSGVPALPRGLMWFGVRVVAMGSRRFGRGGPGLGWKVVQVLGMLVLALLVAGAPALAVLGWSVVYWLATWGAAIVWTRFERSRGDPTNWPWPRGTRPRRKEPPPEELLLIIPKADARGRALAGLLTAPVGALDEDDLAALLV
jgi:hypothetical protein